MTFPLMFGASWIALSGLGSHPFIPIVFTLTSVIVAIVPSSRKALTAALLWCVLAIGGSALTKYDGPP